MIGFKYIVASEPPIVGWGSSVLETEHGAVQIDASPRNKSVRFPEDTYVSLSVPPHDAVNGIALNFYTRQLELQKQAVVAHCLMGDVRSRNKGVLTIGLGYTPVIGPEDFLAAFRTNETLNGQALLVPQNEGPAGTLQLKSWKLFAYVINRQQRGKVVPFSIHKWRQAHEPPEPTGHHTSCPKCGTRYWSEDPHPVGVDCEFA